MKPTKQSSIIKRQSSVSDIAKILQDNPILGAGDYPEAARLIANSSRLQRDLLRELEYYREDPDCDNVRIWHCVHQGPRSSYWMNRWGKYVIVYKCGGWYIKDNHNHVCPAMKSRPAYINISIAINGVVLRPYLHALMSDLFIPNDDFTKIERDHLNGNRLDNNAFNLERVTCKENVRRKFYNYYTRQGRPVPEKYLPV